MIASGRYETSSPEQTEALARSMAETIDGRVAILLVGDLGSGKTVFARGLAEGLGIDPDEVSSPTFALVNRYEGGRIRMYHLDLYRLDERVATTSAYELGLEEMLEEVAVVVIEWAERLAGFPLPDAVRVEVASTSDQERVISILAS